MKLLELNLKSLLERKNVVLADFLSTHNALKISDLSLGQLESFCAQENIDLVNLFSYPLFCDQDKLDKLRSIKLLILDVDGVMTDGGMHYTDKGDELKKYNTKDGMAIKEMRKRGFDIGIISSGYSFQLVDIRAKMLNINHVYVGGKPKMETLAAWCKKLKIDLQEVGIIGDDINDLEVMRNIGFSAAPADAVPVVKAQVDLVLQKKGGKGCIREFIDNYLLETPLT